MDDIIRFENDVQAVCEMTCRNVKSYDTRCKYTPDAKGLDMFKRNTEEYFSFLRQANGTDGKMICADIEGWVTSLGITRKTLHKYYHSRGKDWQEYIDYVKENIVAQKKAFMNNGRISPIVGIFDLTNNFGYYSTNEFHRPIESRGEKKLLSFDEILALSEQDLT